LTHFNHAGILAFRPQYKTVREMNDGLIERWNSVVRQKDTIYHLGDFAFSVGAWGDDLDGIFLRLNGHKHLLVGNHDEKNKKVLRLPWESVEMLRSKLKGENGERATLCHYPLESWRGSWNGSLMLHGHCHGNLKRKLPHRFDVGVECFDTPVRLEALWETAATQKFEATDAHGDGTKEDM
jgi:calcineurin-like phosphoesterase family protein